MGLGVQFVRSKLSRRIIALFVICALLPIALLSAVAFWSVDSQLQEQSREKLRSSTHEEGMSIFERLTFVAADLKLAGLNADVRAGRAVPAASLSPGANRRLAGLELISASGARKAIFGEVARSFELSPSQLEYLRSGKSLLVTQDCGGPERCVFMARRVEEDAADGDLLAAQVLPSYLLDPQTVSESERICVLDQENAPIQCSSENQPAFPADAFQGVVGRFDWQQNGEKYQSAYWQLFLKPNFHADHWTIVASESRVVVMAPLAHFKKIFVLVVLLALWVVLLLSLVQIRRNLGPLSELRKGTWGIARGEFASRVKIDSGDEFEDLAESFNSMAGQIERQFTSLKARNEIDRAILSTWDMDQIVESLLAHLRSVLPYQLACVSLLDRRQGERVRSYLSPNGSGSARDTRSGLFPESEVRELMAHPEGYVLDESGRERQFLLPLSSRGMSHFLVVPVLVRGELAAMFALGSEQGPVWREKDVTQAKQIADEAGVALSNAGLLADLKDLNLGILTALARAIDAKSHWTAGHSERVTDTALKIAREMGLGPKDLEILHRGGLLHDVGKIGISNAVLDKAGKLTAEESAQVREHVAIGKRILEPIPGFAECLPVVAQHHEWVDGSGYPRGLKGEQISIHARIFAVADCYDALISDRPYRAGMPLERVLEILQKAVGTQFDPSVMEAFLRVISRERTQRDEQGQSEKVESPETAQGVRN
jgi:putative nucleotidyltransferase with HDIG domain